MSFPHRLRLAAILLGVILLVSAGLILGLRKTVTLTVDGQSHRFTTYALKVGNLLHDQDIRLSPSDDLSPTLGSWLRNGEQITLRHAIPVQILADGKLINLFSPDHTPSSLLSQAGVEIATGDLLLANGQLVNPGEPFSEDHRSISLQVVRSVSFTFTQAGEIHRLSSTAQTLGTALWAAGYDLFAADQLLPGSTTPLTPGLAASLQPSRPVTIRTFNADVTVRTPATTVGQALEAADLSLQGLDYSRPSPEAAIPPSGIIRLVHVTEEVLVEQTPLPFESEYQPVDDLDLDSQSIVQAGEFGLTAERVRVRYEDGQEITRTVESEWVARQPLPRIIGYGTNVVMHTTTVDGVEIQYWRELSMYATSYHPSEVGDTTASGLPLKKGVAAVDTSLVPFFSEMYIPGYGQAVAADIGGGVIGRWIDLGYSDSDYVPWHQWVTVYFLWPPPANIVWIIP
jgi:resuscitation-promoting factor RpfB